MSGDHYDFTRARWIARPDGIRWSEMVLGRRAVQRRILETGCATVSAYRLKDGRTFYTDPVDGMNKPGSGVLYRVRVRLKTPPVPA